ncbi:MAG: FliA/WhiG family RNA polymerase sigma factor [Actinomycetales bacterium]|nr:FliA/WhiG family RNA polymerase sigma factor [Actinomycetales bacterium]
MPDIAQIRSTEDVEQELAGLWARAAGGADQDARNRLLVHYAPIVRQVASRIAAGLPPQVEFSDLVSAGVIGLIAAIERFDASHGAPFEAYAHLRIRGAILDELRSQDWVPRQVRARQRRITDAIARHSSQHGGYPSNAQIAVLTGMSEKDVAETLEQTWFSVVESLDEVVAGDADERSRHESLVDVAAADPEGSALARERHSQVVSAVAALPQREGDVIRLYYGDRMTLREIGDVLGVTESRASQLRSRALMMLRARVGSDLAA